MRKVFLSSAVLALSVSSAFAGPPSIPDITASTPNDPPAGASIDVSGGDGTATAGNDVGGLSVQIDGGTPSITSAGQK